MERRVKGSLQILQASSLQQILLVSLPSTPATTILTMHIVFTEVIHCLRVLKIAGTVEDGSGELLDELRYTQTKKRKQDDLTAPLMNPIIGIKYSFYSLKANLIFRELENLKASYKRTSKEEVIVDATGMYSYETSPDKYMKARKYSFYELSENK